MATEIVAGITKAANQLKAYTLQIRERCDDLQINDY